MIVDDVLPVSTILPGIHARRRSTLVGQANRDHQTRSWVIHTSAGAGLAGEFLDLEQDLALDGARRGPWSARRR